MDVFGNSVSFLTRRQVFQAEPCKTCIFIRLLFRKLKFPNSSNKGHKMMFLTYEELEELSPLDVTERKLDELLLKSTNEYVSRYLGKDYEDSPAPLKDAVLMIFTDRKDWYRKLQSGDKTEKNLKAAEDSIRTLLEPFRARTI